MSKKTGNSPTDKRQSNYIDKIIKENCLSLLPFICSRILQIPIDKMENFPEMKQQITREKEPDFLRMIYNSKYPKGAVFHLEFELKDSTKMLARMLEYIGILFKKTQKPVLQYVLYLGKGKAKMRSKIRFEQLDYAFRVINIEDFSYLDFINSDVPEEVLLALLMKHDRVSDEELLTLIISRLFILRGKTSEMKKFLNQLTMLSRLRNLQNVTIKKIKIMSNIEYNIEEDIAYIEGVEAGEEKGMEKGIKKGAIKRSIVSIQKMTAAKLEAKQIANFANVELKFVLDIQKQLVKVDKIKALLKKNTEVELIAEKLKVHPLLVEIIQEELNKKK